MLQEWLHSLPEDLQLYDSTGIRRPYYRPVCEIHITYFALIILLQSMHKPSDDSHSHRRPSLSSVVASSCMVSLYEEIHCRQHAHFLLHMHGFFILVAAISQIYYRPRAPEKDAVRRQELNSLCAILRQMRSKYGGADLCLNKITWLRAEVERSKLRDPGSPQQTNLQDDGASGFLPRGHEDVRRLFPFPASFCANMSLFDAGVNDDDGMQLADLVWGEEMAPWMLDEEMSFTEMFGMDIDTFNGINSSFGVGVGVVDGQSA